MKIDFTKKQLLCSKHSDAIVLSDGTGTHVQTGCDFVAFSGIWVYDAHGTNKPGDFCKTFSAAAFEVLPVNYFKNRR